MGPQVLFCPRSFTVRATKQTANVNWDAPIFKDNSLGIIEPKCNRQSGDRFYWGDWNIYCRAHDNNPNNEPGVCNFVVTVKRKWRHFLTHHWVLKIVYTWHHQISESKIKELWTFLSSSGTRGTKCISVYNLPRVNWPCLVWKPAHDLNFRVMAAGAWHQAPIAFVEKYTLI